MQALRRTGITLCKERMHTHISSPDGNALHCTAKAGMLLRLVEVVALDEGLDIEPRPADDEGQAALTLMCLHELGDPRRKLRYREGFVRVQYIHEMMPYAHELLFRRLCTADIKAAVKEHGIARNDIGAKFLCKSQ